MSLEHIKQLVDEYISSNQQSLDDLKCLLDEYITKIDLIPDAIEQAATLTPVRVMIIREAVAHLSRECHLISKYLYDDPGFCSTLDADQLSSARRTVGSKIGALDRLPDIYEHQIRYLTKGNTDTANLIGCIYMALRLIEDQDADNYLEMIHPFLTKPQVEAADKICWLSTKVRSY